MATRDNRTLEKTATPGIYRRHATTCKRSGKCKCPYVVRWKARGAYHKQMFPTLDLAREHKSRLGSGLASRRPLSSQTVAEYYADWLPNYRGRTSRGLQDSSRTELEISFRKHILDLQVAGTRLRDLTAPDVRDWLHELERQGTPPRTIGKAKAALSAMLSCAVEDGDLGSNPVMSARYVPSEAAKRRHTKPAPKELTAADINAILAAMPDEWKAFFTLLAHSGVRIGELLGLTWGNVHLGDDAHITLAEQIYKGKRKAKLKTDKSHASVPLSPGMASWLGELRPEGAAAATPVFASKAGTALNYGNVYNRVLRPALVTAGIATKVGEDAKGRPIYDYHRVGFHRFRHACGSLLQAHGRTAVQAQGWLRHSQLSTTMDIYTHTVDGGVGSAEIWDEILPPSGDNPGATQHPETAANGAPAGLGETAA